MTPDPRFLYLTPTHREALAQLLYCVQEEQGFLVLAGEVGSGKTTLIQAVLSQLNGTADVAYIFNAHLSFEGMLEYMLEDLGLGRSFATRAQRIFTLNNFLIERHRAGRRVVLIIDEAQNLEPETLEEIRLLSNLETSSEKLLQIILVGQPELSAKLQIPQLRQLKQRISLRCQLRPLTPVETRAYVRHRLRVAGSRDLSIFNEEALGRISAYARGIPRVINIVADHCLLLGYAEQRRKIDRKGVEQAIRYLEGRESPDRKRIRENGRANGDGGRLLPWMLAALGSGVAVAVVWIGLHLGS